MFWLAEIGCFICLFILNGNYKDWLIDWLSDNRALVDHIKLAFIFLLRKFGQIWPKLNILCAWLRRKQCKQAICQQWRWLTESIIHHSTVKTMKITSFARFWQNMQWNKQILNPVNSSMKDIIIYYKGRNYT